MSNLRDHLFPTTVCLVLIAAALIGGGVGGLAFAWFIWFHL